MGMNDEQWDLWMSFQRVPGVKYIFNELVYIKSLDSYGSVIAVVSIGVDPVYVVELSSTGHDVHLSESQLVPEKEAPAQSESK